MEHSSLLKPKQAARFATDISAAHLRGTRGTDEVLYVGFTMAAFTDANIIAVTRERVLGFKVAPINRLRPRFDVAGADIAKVDWDRSNGTLTLHLSDATSQRIRGIQFDDVRVLQRHLDRVRDPDGTDPRVESTRMQMYGLPMDGWLRKAIFSLSAEDEWPWLVVHSGALLSSEALVAFDDRLAILKKGASTASLMGRRDAVYFFRDISGVEYHSAAQVNYLRVLAPGTSDLNSAPRMEMATVHYEMARPGLAELGRRISEAGRRPSDTGSATSASAGSDVGTKLAELAGLHAAGALTDEEFAAAKKQVLGPL